jgi:hypothetical protein
VSGRGGAQVSPVAAPVGPQPCDHAEEEEFDITIEADEERWSTRTLGNSLKGMHGHATHRQ